MDVKVLDAEVPAGLAEVERVVAAAVVGEDALTGASLLSRCTRRRGFDYRTIGEVVRREVTKSD